MTSLLQTAITNLQQSSPHRPTPRRASPARPGGGAAEPHQDIESDDDDELVDVITRPGTPSLARAGSPAIGAKAKAPAPAGVSRDPLRLLSTVLAVRIFLQLDIKTLARCDRVCKRWHKSSTLNYVWFLHTRALTLPKLTTSTSQPISDDPDAFDPYERRPALSQLSTPLPASSTPQWSKRESKASWRTEFKTLATRSDLDPEPGSHLQVDVDALSSGYVTPSGHAYAGLGSGSSEKWTTGATGGEGGSGAATPPKSKKEMREAYKAMGGRKAKEKGKFGNGQGMRDREGMGGREQDYEAPW